MTDPKTPLTPNYVCGGTSSGAAATTTSTTVKPAAGTTSQPAAGSTSQPAAGSKDADAKALAAQFFDQCDADKSGRITGREFWGCIRKNRNIVWNSKLI